jgi:hypothetical protein
MNNNINEKALLAILKLNPPVNWDSVLGKNFIITDISYYKKNLYILKCKSILKEGFNKDGEYFTSYYTKTNSIGYVSYSKEIVIVLLS